MTPITPDLQQSIFTTVYLTFAHNYIAFAYFVGIIIGTGLAFYRPSRFSIVILIGFTLLLFSFEYDKHIIEPLRNQTIQSLATEKAHYRFNRVVDVLISEVLPIVFYTTGWGLIFASVIYSGIHEGKKRERK